MRSLYLCFVVIFTTYVHSITIDTPLGQIEGLKQDIKDVGSIYEFRKIPYAKPPVGERRFKKPESYGPWSGILNATTYGPSCMQGFYMFPFPYLPNTDVDEDCLHLNIFAPFDTDRTSKRSVMVWIHGGAYVIGQGMAYNATNLALVGNVIVVTINYRLGAFGFFYTGDSNGQGNYALWDQKLALEWVNENIEWFGGNTNSVTIFGESAGAFSVSILSLNPQTRGLYQRVIAQSGDSTASIALGEPSAMKENYKVYADKLGCGFNPLNSTAVVDCLRRLPANDLLSAQMHVPDFGPTVDGDFLVDHPITLLKNSTSEAYMFFKTLDFMSGTNDADGSISVPYLGMVNTANFTVEDGIPSTVFCDSVLPGLIAAWLPKYSDAIDVICEKYKDTSSLAAQGKSYVNMCSDAFLLIPSIRSLNAHSYRNTQGKTYQYMFAHTNKLVKTFLPRYDWVTGAGHGDELIFLFGMEDAADRYNTQLSQSDILLVKQVSKYWTNFAKFGDPNGEDLPMWPEYDVSGKRYLHIGSTPMKQSRVYDDRVRFWMMELPNLGTSYTHTITIDTNIGKIQGLQQDIDGVGSIYKFLNIPYAKPPVGERRFKKPELYGPWSGILNATKYGPSCMQNLNQSPFPFLRNKNIDEDCLSLNIFAPSDTNRTSNRSVMVWIHGGGFVAGQGMAYDSTTLAITGNVIVVTINYRLGVFGFFYTGDSNAPGNYALWDQKLALEWVNENIEWYGGNKNSVTIFGESVGSVSVSLLSINPQTRGLFQRVVAQSGSALLAVAKPSESKEMSTSFAKRFSCAPDLFNTTAVVNCMKDLSASALLTVQNTGPPFSPTIDSDFILDHPLTLLQNTTSMANTFYRSLDFISGTNDADGALLLQIIRNVPSANFSLEDGIPSEYFCNVLMPMFVASRIPSYSEIKDALCEKYKNPTSLAGQGKNFIDLLSDVNFLLPSIQSLNAHAYGNPIGKTYQYLFTHTNELVKAFSPRYEWITGAAHGDELLFLFDMENAADKYGLYVTPSDILLVKQLAEYWTNFAKTGDPNGNNLPVWPMYDKSRKKYIRFGSIPSQDSDVFADRVRLLMPEKPTMETTTNGPISVAPSINDIQICFLLFVLLACII